MGSLNDSGMGIGDFALSMMGQKSSTPSVKKTPTNQVDITDVAVSQSQRNVILEQSFGISQPEPEKVDEQELLEIRKRELKEEFLATSARLKELMAEMASVGMTSTGQLGTGPQKKLKLNCRKCNGPCRCNKKSNRR